MSHCNDKSCCCSKGGESSCSCSSCQKGCGCSQGGCKSCGGQKKECGCSKTHKLLCVADEAWLEVLKEEMKNHIRNSDTHSKIKELAKLVSDANHKKWKGKMEQQECCYDYEHKIMSCLRPDHCDNK